MNDANSEASNVSSSTSPTSTIPINHLVQRPNPYGRGDHMEWQRRVSLPRPYEGLSAELHKVYLWSNPPERYLTHQILSESRRISTSYVLHLVHARCTCSLKAMYPFRWCSRVSSFSSHILYIDVQTRDHECTCRSHAAFLLSRSWDTMSAMLNHLEAAELLSSAGLEKSDEIHTSKVIPYQA